MRLFGWWENVSAHAHSRGVAVGSAWRLVGVNTMRRQTLFLKGGRVGISVRLLGGGVKKSVGTCFFSGGWIGEFREVARGYNYDIKSIY